jgi:O-antigen/teichoic acid export membrane protein
MAGRLATLLTGLAAGLGIAVCLLPDASDDASGRAAALFAIALALPAYALTDFQDGIGRAQNRIVLALAPPYLIRPLLMLAITGLILWSGFMGGASAAAAALAAATWCTAAMQFAWQEPGLRHAFPTAERRFAHRLWFSVSLPLLLVDGFGLLLTNVDVMLLEVWAGAEMVGIYFAAVRTVSVIAFVQFAISAAASARLSALYSSGSRTEIEALLRQARMWSLALTLAGAVPILVAGKWLLSLFGEGFAAGYPAMVIIACGLIGRAAAGPAQNLLMVGGRQMQAAAILGAAVAINLALCGLLIPVMGLQGAALATAAAFCFEASASILLARRHVARMRIISS